MAEKIAVVMFNLGGPDSTSAIRPFLMNFFMDKNIIRLPLPLRFLLATLISSRRSKREAGDSYGELGGKSPLLENTNAQADALENVLEKDSRGTKSDVEFKTFVAMRYWHPMIPQIVREVQEWGADKIVIVPMYPQFSTTTTWSSLEVWKKETARLGLDTPTSMACCYYKNKGFIEASAENIKIEYDKAVKDGHEAPRVLFSAHGLPESVIEGGDPYQRQCEETAEVIAEALEIKNLDWQICYQSRVGPKKWIGPSVDEALEEAALDNKAVVIYPHSFTQEHVETLVELDIEYAEEAKKIGQRGYYRAKTVGVHAAFVDGLADLVFEHLNCNGIEAKGFRTLCSSEIDKNCVQTGSLTNGKKVA